MRGQACANCARSGRECSFVAPPLIRHPKEGDQSPLNAPDPLQSPHGQTRSPHQSQQSHSQSATSSHQSGSSSSLGLNGMGSGRDVRDVRDPRDRDPRDSRDSLGRERDIRDPREIRDVRDGARDPRDDRERKMRELELRHREVERGREKERERDREQKERERQRDGYFHPGHGSHGSGSFGHHMHGSHASLGSPRSSAGDSRHGPSPMVSPQLNFYPGSSTAPRSRSRETLPTLPTLPSRENWITDRSLSFTATPASQAQRAAPGASVLSFLDSLDDAAIGAPKVSLSRGSGTADRQDSDGYTSLDMDVTDEEESHYLGMSPALTPNARSYPAILPRNRRTC